MSDLPEPVGIRASVSRPSTAALTTASWPGRKSSNPNMRVSATRSSLMQTSLGTQSERIRHGFVTVRCQAEEAVKSGAPEGASRPPSGSTVTATVCPGSTGRVKRVTPGRSKRPALFGTPFSKTQIW